MLVPSKDRFTGKGRISGSAEKNFSALSIPGSSQPLTKRGLVDMARMLSVSRKSSMSGPGQVRTFPILSFGRSRPAADASREVVERWLLDGLEVSVGHRRYPCDPSSQKDAGRTPASQL